MAAGDIFQLTGSAGATSKVTTSLPSGTDIVASGAGIGATTLTRLGFDDGTNTETASHLGDPSDGHGLQSRPLYGDGVDPRIQNTDSNSRGFHIAGREV